MLARDIVAPCRLYGLASRTLGTGTSPPSGPPSASHNHPAHGLLSHRKN